MRMGVPFRVADPYRYLSRDVIRWWHEGPVPAHRLRYGVTSQHPYWIGMSCTGMGPSSSTGCPILGCEVPSQPLYWDGGPVLEWGVLYRNGRPHISSCAGMGSCTGSEIPDGSSCRDGSSVPRWGPAMGSCTVGAWALSRAGDSEGTPRCDTGTHTHCCECSRCGISGCCCALGALFGVLECLGTGTAG